jgi:hypothetical protein
MNTEDERIASEDSTFATDSPRVLPCARSRLERRACEVTPGHHANEWDNWKSVRDVG